MTVVLNLGVGPLRGGLRGGDVIALGGEVLTVGRRIRRGLRIGTTVARCKPVVAAAPVYPGVLELEAVGPCWPVGWFVAVVELEWLTSAGVLVVEGADVTVVVAVPDITWSLLVLEVGETVSCLKRGRRLPPINFGKG